MKRKLFFSLIALFAIGLVVVGCSNGSTTTTTGTKVTVTFELGTAGGVAVTGTEPEAQTIDKDAGITVPPAPTAPTGYVFTGWVIKGTTTPVTSDTKFSVNTTVVATWEAFDPETQAMVKFYTNTAPMFETIAELQAILNGAASFTVIVDKDTAIGAKLPANPTKDGYEFIGWAGIPADTDLTSYTSLDALASLSKDVDADAEFDKDYNVIAIWNEEEGPGGEEPFEPPSDWVGFTDAEMLAGSFYVDDGGDGSTIGKNQDGTFDVTIKTRASGNRSSVVWFTFADDPGVIFRNGWAVLLDLPTTGAYRPVSVDIVPSTTDNGGAPDGWSASMNSEVTGDIDATFDGDYVVGQASFHWGTEEAVFNDYKTISIWLTWDPMVEAGEDYTFTIKHIKVLPHDTSIVDPDPEAWTPAPVAAPAGWTDFPSASITSPNAAYPSAAITGTGPYTVTTTTRSPTDGSGQNHLTFALPAGQVFTKGLYVSITLPTGLTLTNSNRPKQVFLLPGGGWGAAQVAQNPPNWIEGKVDLLFDNPEDTTEYANFTLEIYWDDGVAGDPLTFTINSVKVAELGTSGGPGPVDFFSAADVESSPTATFDGDQVTIKTANNYNNTAIISSINFKVADKQFLGGFSLSVTLPDDSSLEIKDIAVLATLGDTWSEPSSYVSQKQETNPSGTVVFSWDGKLWSGETDTTARDYVAVTITYASDTEVGEEYTFTLNHVLVGELVDKE